MRIMVDSVRRGNTYCSQGAFAKMPITLSRETYVKSRVRTVSQITTYAKSRVGGSDPPTLNLTYVRQIPYLLKSPGKKLPLS